MASIQDVKSHAYSVAIFLLKIYHMKTYSDQQQQSNNIQSFNESKSLKLTT